MARMYKILPGCSFKEFDGSLKGGGETIELEDDVAAAHADKIEPVPAPAPGGEHEAQ